MSIVNEVTKVYMRTCTFDFMEALGVFFIYIYVLSFMSFLVFVVASVT